MKEERGLLSKEKGGTPFSSAQEKALHEDLYFSHLS